ncbi:MAG: 16S rRNA (cytidine(1402)-2'-O)-methyltransferase [Candidatus Omnitrophica bacterium]|nr:16S rRNA (cytidine(1402)-2'-O)-methyltransferase [Candidatus Omnitrophota bacterium]
MLYIVATPIGNLSDITLRALDVLRSVDLIACEDTRHTLKLLNHYGINKPLTSYYEHNKLSKGEHLIKLLKEGKNIALVSDSGTPGISDPGFHIVKLALENDISVSPIPGASALAAALSVAGIPANRFVFEGFLPVKSGARKKKLLELSKPGKTIILYESPYRFLKLLDEVKEVFGDVEVTVCREITKKFEEIKKGPIDAVLAYYKANKTQATRGEFSVILNPASRD